LSYALYILVSAVGGLLVGVLGTGSTLLLLPSLVLVFGATLPGADALRLAAGTTLASMSVGAVSGAVAQYRRGQLDLALFGRMLPPYVLGGLLGPWINRAVPVSVLGIYVSLLILVIGLRMLFVAPARPGTGREYRDHPLETRLVFFVIGVAGSIAGIASGIFAIPYLSRFSLSIRTAIGTSTASAAVYAICGTIGYVSSGWSAPDLPRATLGYVYLPAFLVMAATAVIAAPLGVRAARFVDEVVLRRLFAGFLLVASAAVFLTR